MTDSYATHQATVDVEANATDRLSRLHGAVELRAALLALLLAPGSKRAARAWEIETAGAAGVEGLREQAASLSGAARLPWVEVLLSRMALQPIAARKELLQATRRIMAARGAARPIDRLHWLAMRRGLGEVPPLAARAEAERRGGRMARVRRARARRLHRLPVAHDPRRRGGPQRGREVVCAQS